MSWLRRLQFQQGSKLLVICVQRYSQRFDVCRCCGLKEGKVDLLHRVGCAFVKFDCLKLRRGLPMYCVKKQLASRDGAKSFLQIHITSRDWEDHRLLFGHTQDAPLLKIGFRLVKRLQELLHRLPIFTAYVARSNIGSKTNLRDICFKDFLLDQVLSV